MLFKNGKRIIRILLAHNYCHAHSHVECLVHFLVGYVSEFLHDLEYFLRFKRLVQRKAYFVGHTLHLSQTAACYVRNSLNIYMIHQFQNFLHINLSRYEQNITYSSIKFGNGVMIRIAVLGEYFPCKGVAI